MALPIAASGGLGVGIGTLITSMKDADEALKVLKPINEKICSDILADKGLGGKPRAVMVAFCDHLPNNVIEIPIQLHYVIEAAKANG